MKISELGEFNLIDLLARMVAQEASALGKPIEGQGFQLLLGIGDDAAAWRAPSSTQLFTTDTMVQGVHFVLGKIGWEELGWKAMAVNYSDIAAMGGAPFYSLVTLGLPKDTEVEAVTEMYRGMLQVCREYGGLIVGGDMVGSPVLFVTIALYGAVDGPPLTRSAASPGDRVAVTGNLGSSGGGLRMLLQGLSFDSKVARYLREAHNRPRPRVSQGQTLRRMGVKAAMDVSDGLTDDLSKMCQASGVSAVVYAGKVPVHPVLRRAFPHDYQSMALAGGEDYELLFTTPQEVMARVLPALGISATVIGQIVPGDAGKVTVLDEDGHPVQVDRSGWDHFLR